VEPIDLDKEPSANASPELPELSEQNACGPPVKRDCDQRKQPFAMVDGQLGNRQRRMRQLKSFDEELWLAV